MSSDPSQDKKFDAKRYALRMWHLLVSSLKNIKSGNFKKWIAPGIALILSIILLWNLGGKVREEVWAYYTDGEDINISAEENKARYVLWEPPSPTILPQGENTKNIKKGPSGNFEAAFSSDGRKMAIVLEQENGADIFVSNWDGLAWSSPEPLSKINSKFNERGPSFSLSGNRLFFSSDRDGGLGGYDIYVTTFDGEKWGSPQSLGSTLNSSANETGPAPSMDESGLYFSSDREGKSDQDIFYAKLDNEDTKEALSFLQPIAVDDLNSRSDDIQAALTRRGSLVFMSSDRQSDSRYGVYMSRIIDGQIRDPERVDLYLKNDNVTDPAVRMDGFDLLFSTDYGASDSESSDYRLYRSTTREVFGYYDSSRWEEFKLALGKLKWWLIAALAALLALIYLLETWQDITSLLHKCIAASIAAHLLLLLLATAWFITQEFEPDPESELSEIEISLDALAQEELAMESAPEEAQISDPTEQITIEKTETSFDIPELQAQDLVENVVDTNTDFQDSMEIEVEASQTQIEENTETPKLEQSSLIAELSEPTLPEIDDFALEEDPNPNTNEPEETEQEVFEPSFETTEITKAEISEVSDSAVESESESEAVESGSLVAEATEAESQLTESGSSNNELSPTSELATGALPELAMLEPGAPQLEELEGEPGAQPADTSEDTFEPSGGVAKLETEQEASGATSDSAVESESESEAVESGSLVAEATEAESQLTESGSSNNELSPTSELATGALPELAMLEPGAPQLEELEGEPGAQPADTSEDTFEPSGGVAKLETEQEASGATSDSAVESESESEAVESGSLVAEATEAESQLTESGSSNNELSPTSELATGALPELAMLEPGAPQLEELEGEPGAQPADTSEDTFEPSGGVAKLETEQEASGATSDSAVESESESEAVESGSLVAEATEAESQLTESGSSNNELSPTSELATGALPELAMLEPGAPQLEELEGEPGAQPADTSEDTFEPSGGVAKLETEQEASGATSDSAVESESESEAVESGSLVAEATEAESQLTESGSSNNELSPTSELATGALPELAMLEPGAPQLEELEGEPGAQPADTSEDTFEPSGGVAKLETEQEASGATSDSAVESESESEAVESGSLVAEATEAESQLTESGSSNNELSPTSELATGALPELAMLEPGAPQLEELEGEPGAQPADTSEDTFEPSGGVAKLETEQEASGATSDSAVESESESEAVESGSLVAEATEAESQLTESGSSNNELSPTSELATGALPVYAISAPLLPDALEDNQTDLKKGGLTELIKKHRGKPSLEVIKQLGGSDATEKAIIAAIEWLSKVQEKDGRWDTRKFQAETDYDVGGTALALLCYYGWGARHDRPGKYQNNVKKALEWLLAQQREDGSLARRGMMYSHAIAAIALCEAYGITKDDKIKSSALAAIEYTINSQHQERGGWRYSPGQDSDTSVTGWQLMALHSARMAGLELPEKPFDLARRWLDFAGGGEHGGLYGYQSPSDISRAMVATGMFCRQLDMVAPSSPKMIESAELMKRYPIRDNNPDLYYIYYGTLALYQHQGPIWQQWNNNLKRILPDIQIKSGSLAGSWDLSRSNTKGGGRIASTTLAILSLEVYYRILPMYGFRGDEPPEAKIKLEDTRQ